MAGYITYMGISLNSEGIAPKELTEKLTKIGWKPIYGRYDFAYEWGIEWGDKDKNMQEFFDHIHRTHVALTGSNVNYSLKTYEQGKENFPVKWAE